MDTFSSRTFPINVIQTIVILTYVIGWCDYKINAIHWLKPIPLILQIFCLLWFYVMFESIFNISVKRSLKIVSLSYTFALLGDTFLIFECDIGVYMGLMCFSMTHILLLLFLLYYIPYNPILYICVLVGSFILSQKGLMILDILRGFPYPILIELYALILCINWILSCVYLYKWYNVATVYLFTGITCLIVSDIILGKEMFGIPFESIGSKGIILTYWMGMNLILWSIFL